MHWALGPLNLKPSEFWALTWADFCRMCEGYEHRQAREWELVRWQMTLYYNSILEKNKPRLKPQDVLHLDWIDKPLKRGKVKAMYSHEEFLDLKNFLGIG